MRREIIQALREGKMFRALLIGFHNSGTYGHRCLSAALKANGCAVSNVFFQRNVIQVAQPLSQAEIQALVGLAQQIAPELIGIKSRKFILYH